MKRSRFVYAVLIGTIILIGLIVHSHIIPLQPALRKYLGDALWAAVAFFMFGLILNRASTGTVAFSAFIFSASIEISQLYHSPGIDSIRATLLGGLVLGSTFNWPDFIAYAIGIGLGVSSERTLMTRESFRNL
jgi:hypothetical protein